MTASTEESRRQASLAADRATLEAIGSIYCRAHHGGFHGRGEPGDLCPECRAVVGYAMTRTERCPNNHEGNCKDCAIHCYNAEMRESVRAMMAYSAPRMLLRHPVMTLRYLRKKLAARKQW